ncbi:PKD domain-containing protein [Pseudohaliea rubra]|uniref:PKD domain-containing protein n=1 Tax=Pseudohaliea rubra TaxID=475795 RepID=UPI00068A897C|nr:hypothetical protein [Pseudohaliea rubra]
MTLEFEGTAVLVAGGTTTPDLHIFEIGSAVEAFRVEISQDGSAWITIGEVSGQPSSVDIDASPDVNTGDTFAFVRLTDMSGTNNGADIDAVGVNPDFPAPTSDAGADQAVASRQSVVLDGTGSSSGVNGLLITYAWTQLSGSSVSLTDPTSATPAFVAPLVTVGSADEALVFELVVTDELGQASNADTITVSVSPPDDTPPTADAGRDQAVVSEATVTLDGSGSRDPDPGDSISYQWRQLSGPVVSLSDVTAAAPSFTAPERLVTDEPITLVFELVVTDSQGESSVPDQVTITVSPPGDTPPTADAGPDQAVVSEATVTLDGSGSRDPDPGDSISYQWRQLSGPVVSLGDVTSAAPGFTAPELLVTDDPRTLVFELVVTDLPGLQSAPDRVLVTVSPPRLVPPHPVAVWPPGALFVLLAALAALAYRSQALMIR